jgi:hypothetical protein
MPMFLFQILNTRPIISITTEEIIDNIKILIPNKASGPGIISYQMLKICPEKYQPLFK